MRKKLLLVMTLIFSFAFAAMAQDRVVSGRVTDPDSGEPLPGVNVVVKGTTIGVITDFDGRYSLSVPADAVLTFSGVGFKAYEVEVGAQSVIDTQLELDQLSEVVITAIGVEKEKIALGYATQEFKSDAIEQKGTNNVLQALQGKVAGVNITGSSGAAGASTNINIRGITSFTGSNQPLFIVDGIPVSNDVDQFGNTLFSNQAANRALDINPDMIESVNILKGPAAAALYGSRASAGAIVITTKAANKAMKPKKTEVTLASSLLLQDVYGVPAFQNAFGQGTLGNYNDISTLSWGLPFRGAGVTETFSNVYGTQPYRAVPNNVTDFYRQGQQLNNTLTLSGSNGQTSYLASIGRSEQNGIVPNSQFLRTNVQLAANTKFTNGLKVGGTFTYTNSVQDGTTLGNGGSAFGQLTRIPRSFDLANLQFQDAVTGGSIYFNPTINNPRWAARNVLQGGTTDRITGNVTLAYDVRPWFEIKYRAGVDSYTTRNKGTFPIGDARNTQGLVQEDMSYRNEFTQDLMLNFKKDNLFFEGFNVNLLLGQQINQRRFQNTFVNAAQLNIPNFFNTSNASVFTGSGESQSLRRLVGYYGQLSLSYKNMVFVELTGRMDQSSTLPTNANTFFYPAASISLVLTEMFNVDPSILSLAKIRANYATVGRDADPYLLQTVFVSGTYGNNLASVTFPLTVGSGTFPGFGPSARIGNQNLKPEFVTSYEIGTNLGFLKNKINVEFNYFYSLSTDQILNVSIPLSSGFGTRTTNVGSMRNEGIELLVNAEVLNVGGFRWDLSLNYTRIRNKVLSIAPGITQFAIPGNGFIGITPSIVLNRPYGMVVSSAFPRNPAGDLLINPVTGGYNPAVAGVPISDPNPNWNGGIMNTFSYKGLALSILFDTQQGGQLYSFAAQDLKALGALHMTGENRNLPRILPGVIDNLDGTFRPNNIQINPQAYWGALGGLASEAAVFDATRYSLRELTFGYSLPKSLLQKTPFGDISFSIVGRNLWFFAPGFPGDPETNTQGAGNIRGMDLNGPLNTRNYGFNLRITL